MPRPPDDEPRSQPFQPMSYDLAPEFSTPAPPAPPQPPVYQPPTTPGYPQQPTFQQPAYQQPTYQQPPPQQQYGQQPSYPQQAYQQPQQQPVHYGPPPVTPARRGNGLKITLSILAVVFLVCTVGMCVFLAPVFSEYGATVTAPEQLPGGLAKKSNPDMDPLINELETELKTDVGAEQVAAGFYQAADSPGKPVLLVAASALIFNPETQLDDAFKGIADADITVEAATAYEAGALGGTLKCAKGTIGDEGGTDNVDVAMCVWADHGSFGIGFFFERDVVESAELFLDIRNAVQTRS